VPEETNGNPATTTNTAAAAADEAGAEKRPSLSELAQKAFGQNFHGEVKPTEGLLGDTVRKEGEADDDAGSDADDEAAAAAAAAAAAEAGTTDDDDGQNQTDDDDKGDTGADDEVEISTFAELRQHLEADDEWLGGLQMDVEVNGKTSQVPLRDLVANYQTNQAADERLEQAKTKSAEAAQLQARQTAALEVQFNIAAQAAEAAETMLLSEMAEVDWDALRQEDPGRWAAERQRFTERKGAIEQLKNKVVEGYREWMTQQQNELQEKQKEYVEHQRGLLASTMPKVSPDWGDPQKLQAAKTRLADYAISSGYTKEELANTVDHRMLITLEKARLYDAAQGKLDVTRQRIRKVPRVMKPGASRGAQVVNLQAQQKARQNLEQTGSIDDALALVKAKRKA